MLARSFRAFMLCDFVGLRGGGYAGIRVPCHVRLRFVSLRGAPRSLRPAFRTRVPQARIHVPHPAPALHVPNRAPCYLCLARRVPHPEPASGSALLISRISCASPNPGPCSPYAPISSRSLVFGPSDFYRALRAWRFVSSAGMCIPACTFVVGGRRDPLSSKGPRMRNAASVLGRRRKTGDSCKKGGL